MNLINFLNPLSVLGKSDKLIFPFTSLAITRNEVGIFWDDSFVYNKTIATIQYKEDGIYKIKSFIAPAEQGGKYYNVSLPPNTIAVLRVFHKKYIYSVSINGTRVYQK